MPLTVLASPVYTRRSLEERADVRDATAEEIAELEYYSALSANVYCIGVIPGGTWVCPNCDKTNNLEIVDTFTTIVYDTNVLIARSDSEKTIYIVFRGSVSIQNWLADLTATLVPYPDASLTAYVHTGFLASYTEVQSKLMSTVKSQMNAHSEYKVAVTGHSLGGATALLCALDLHQQGVSNIELFTFGQPRVGNAAFAKYVVDTGIPYKRTVHERDTVPHVPSVVAGFLHAGMEFWDVPLSSKVQVCPNGIETADCSNSVATLTSFVDHTTYFDMSTGICL
ncbi:catalysis At the Interface: the anatomy of A conformational change in A triglyceride lipase [Zychaea mexicana]|uniref:catalysis At the Interface: the anatomy of A conformational change in A triglyceride lipase n=1 Tax=Zychaea mexicana TaxID=64656 RepID=UPI0022FE5D5B|nr:catalysis At the Interface: the anatomy of A conformational change in A triglyceride lipase [Zychaea mexicana]KAI9495081.1 catalysis At the Interface: the anatomy of A conformational change in A triglyceride lipase [Zychaea mexicana]